MTDVGFQDLQPLIVGAFRRLMKSQQPNGAINYVVDVATGEVNNRAYSMVRMAGTAYSLAWAANALAGRTELGDELSKASERSLEFLIRACELQPTGYYVGEYTFEAGLSQTGKVGASALLALALMHSPHSAAYTKPIELLMETMLKCQRDDGGFWGFVGEQNISGQRYAPGECLLAFAHYYEQTRQPEILLALHRAFPYYLKYYAFDPHQGLILWHADAWSRVAQITGLERAATEAYTKFADALVCELPGRQVKCAVGSMEHPHQGGFQFGKTPGVSSALYAEALARVAQMHSAAGSQATAALYAESAVKAVPFLARLQVQEAAANREQVVGGFRSNLSSTILRMDNDQHVITCCLALIESQEARGKKP